jgi:hypothetical protein
VKLAIACKGRYLDEIEFELPEVGHCACCGARQEILTRYVTRNGNAFAIYKAVLTFGQHPHRAHMIAGFGRWEEDADPSERVAITFDLWSDEGAANITIVDERDSSWSSGFLGKVLEREVALKHPLSREVFGLMNHVARCDEAVSAYLG